MVQCPSPDIVNGRVTSGKQDKYSVGQQVEFQCNPGYTMWGSQKIQCWSDGNWKPPVPYCDKGELKWRFLGGSWELHLRSTWEQQRETPVTFGILSVFSHSLCPPSADHQWAAHRHENRALSLRYGGEVQLCRRAVPHWG